MTEWMLGGLVVCGAMLATIGATGYLAYRFFKLGFETGKDMQYHEDLHAGGVGELNRVEPAGVEPEDGETDPVTGPTVGRLHSAEDAAEVTATTLVPLHEEYLFTHGRSGVPSPPPPVFPGTELSDKDIRWISIDSHFERTADAADTGGHQ